MGTLARNGLKHLVNQLNVKKELEMVIFKSRQKKFEGDLKIKLCGKRLSHWKCEIPGCENWYKSILLFLTPTYHTAALLSGLKIVVLFNEL